MRQLAVISVTLVLLPLFSSYLVHADISTLYRRCECPATSGNHHACFCLRTRNCSAVDYLPFCPQPLAYNATASFTECGIYEKCCDVSAPLLSDSSSSCDEETCPLEKGEEQEDGVYDSCGTWSKPPGSFHMPWVATLFYLDDVIITPLCGVTVVHPRVVLTAAGCLKRAVAADRLEVVAGTDWILRIDGDAHVQRSPVVRALETLYQFDVALLELERPLSRDPGLVDVLCLQQPDTQLDLCACWSVSLQAQSGDVSDESRWSSIKLRVLKHKTCENLFWDFKSDNFILHEGFTCAVGDYAFCPEDYGAPVVCPLVQDRSRFVLAGILAEPPDPCGSPQEPTRLIDTGYFSFWIQRTLEDLGYENYAVHPPT